jgi:D-arabinose 1-dehydrogenase-like Zn-dependent alcohol dehydrogenase
MPVPKLFLAAFVARLTSRQRCVASPLKTDAELFERLAALAARNGIVPHIGEVIDLDQVASVQRRMKKGKVHGQVCVRVNA